MSAVIKGLGHYLPSQIRTNAELAARLNVTEDWIFTKTGIKERRIATTGSTSDLAVPACEACLQHAGVSRESIDCVIVCTVTPDHMTPATAATLIGKLKLQNAWGFDLSAACAGFIAGLVTAASMVEVGSAKRILLVAADKLSTITNLDDRKTAVLLGDGAGAVLIERSANPEIGLQDAILMVDPSGEPELFVPAGGSVLPASFETVAERKHYLFLSGYPVFNAAVDAFSNITSKLMKRNGVTATNLDWFVPHQANLRILEVVCDRLEIPREKLALNIENYGNTSAATIPILLSEMVQRDTLKYGDRLVLSGMGAGYTAGSAYFRWAIDK